MISKRAIIAFLLIISLSPTQAFSQNINLSNYSGSYNVKVGDFREYRIFISSSFKGIHSDSFYLENGSLATFNTTNSLVYRFTVAKINQTNDYVQESVNTHYQLQKSFFSKPTTATGLIKSQLMPADISGYLFPVFPNESMVNNYLKDTTSNTTQCFCTRTYSVTNEYYTVSSKTLQYPYNSLGSYTVNWKTGWLQQTSNKVESIEIAQSNLVSNIINSPIIIVGLVLLVVFVATGTTLFIKYKNYNKKTPEKGASLSFINYTRNLVKPKKKITEKHQEHDIDPALQKIEDIIEESK